MQIEDARGLLERAFACVNEGDIEGSLEVAHPDIRWLPPEGGASPSVYEGLEGVRAFTAEWLDPWDEFQQELIDIEMKGDRSLAKVRVTARGESSGVPFQVEVGYINEYRDGKISRMEIFPQYSDAAAAF